jgi:superoxide dismutase, Fe-Mn family
VAFSWLRGLVVGRLGGGAGVGGEEFEFPGAGVDVEVAAEAERIVMAIYTLPDLPYDYAALEPAISGEILELHHAKHHAAYVKGANDTLEQLAESRDRGQFGTLVGLEKTLAFNLSGHVLHPIFWQNLSGDGGDRPDGVLRDAITAHFGSFDAFAAQLSTATTGVQGSGWGILAWKPLGRRPIIQQVYDHHGNVGQASIPLLVFDAWEHAYYLQYRNVRPDYVSKLWDIVNWADVTARYLAATSQTGAAQYGSGLP